MGLSNAPVVAVHDAGGNLVVSAAAGAAAAIEVALQDAWLPAESGACAAAGGGGGNTTGVSSCAVPGGAAESPPGPSGAALAGTLQRAAVGGLAAFGDLSVDLISYEVDGFVLYYRLAFAAPGLHEAFSEAFEVLGGAPDSLEVKEEPGAAAGGAPFGVQPEVSRPLLCFLCIFVKLL